MKVNSQFLSQQTLRRVLLVLLDILLVNISAFFALWLRFEFDLGSLASSGFLAALQKSTLSGTVITLLVFTAFHLYSSLWEFAGERELVYIGEACALSAAMWWVSMSLLDSYLPRSFPLLHAMILFMLVSASRYSYRLARRYRQNGTTRSTRGKKRTMLIGAGASASMALKEFETSDKSGNYVVCLIDDDRTKHGKRVRGVKVVGGRDRIVEAAERYRVEEIILCIPSAPMHVRKEILEICEKTRAQLKTLPALSQLANGEVSVRQIRDISLEDLLGRAPVGIDNAAVGGVFHGKTVLVTGGGGSIGSELCRQIATFAPKELIIFDIYENNAYDIQQELRRNHPELKLTVLIGSVREEARVNAVFAQYKPQIVCHAAAHKHVPLMEDSPAEAIKNNVFGTYNVSRAAGEHGAELFLLISTDKAVNPTNVMGATKRLCEMVEQSMNERYATKYIAVRFGNVLGSNGSVIPLFRRQIAAGGPVTVTHKEVTRFFMTIPEAVSLILQASAFARGGEVFVLDMGTPVKIDDMARKMIRLCGLEPDVDIKVEYTGLRPGEKLYEELLLKSEGLQKT
ncbi:MAG: polysaccharide biosynthesis protein, partial [Oscillospiraceae bacterium]|nr:polysaccharide biosynthesis protein [Oscillospiraceae bacterium]